MFLILILLIAAAIVAVVLLRRRSQDQPAQTPQAASAASGTVLLQSEKSIRLRRTDNPDKVWELPLAQTIRIGREPSCQVCLDESSVSRQQCVIYAGSGGVPLVENRSTSNITQVNKVDLYAPHTLQPGDQIKCGNVILIVDFIRSDSSGNINRMTQFVNV